MKKNESTSKNSTRKTKRELKLSIVSGDVQAFHGKRENKYATFQVASQFNCLEFVSPGK